MSEQTSINLDPDTSLANWTFESAREYLRACNKEYLGDLRQGSLMRAEISGKTHDHPLSKDRINFDDQEETGRLVRRMLNIVQEHERLSHPSLLRQVGILVVNFVKSVSGKTGTQFDNARETLSEMQRFSSETPAQRVENIKSAADFLEIPYQPRGLGLEYN